MATAVDSGSGIAVNGAVPLPDRFSFSSPAEFSKASPLEEGTGTGSRGEALRKADSPSHPRGAVRAAGPPGRSSQQPLRNTEPPTGARALLTTRDFRNAPGGSPSLPKNLWKYPSPRRTPHSLVLGPRVLLADHGARWPRNRPEAFFVPNSRTDQRHGLGDHGSRDRTDACSVPGAMAVKRYRRSAARPGLVGAVHCRSASAGRPGSPDRSSGVGGTVGRQAPRRRSAGEDRRDPFARYGGGGDARRL